jgi:hypothetical protein
METTKRIRDRDRVVSKLLPKLFGIIAQMGHRVPGYGRCAAMVGEDVIITGTPIDSDRVMLSVYYPSSRSDVQKVFSAHVSSVSQFGDVGFYQYWDNHVGVMSWRRDGWEELIMSQEIDSLTISQAFAGQIFSVRPVN